MANPSIKFEWQNLPTIEDAVDPTKFDHDKHRRVNFLDLNIKIIFTMIPSCSVMLEFGVYSKPWNAFSYIPYGSYHQRHIFCGWLKAEVYRLLPHCSNAKIWIEECRNFYDHQWRRGYPAYAIKSTFRAISWNQRLDLLKRKIQGKKDFCEVFFDLPLVLLKMNSDGDIFPSQAFFSVKSALPLGHALLW